MATQAKPPARRMGPRDSESSLQLLDAAERVLRNEGYGAISSRRVAEEAGLKQQLVYYYFQSMEELLLACFQRRTARALAKLAEDAASAHPVRAIWNTLSNASDGKLSFEFMALANHNEAIRLEISRFVAQARAIEAEAFVQRMDSGADLGPILPAAAAFLLSSSALMLGREAATGIDTGHPEKRDLIDRVLIALD